MARVTGSGSASIPNGSTAAINISITWSDAGSHTPTAYLIVGRSGTAGSTSAATIRHSEGLCDGTNSWCMAGYTEDGASVPEAALRHTDDGVLVECDSGGAQTGLLVHTSFASNQITVTPSDAFSVDWHITVVAFSGFDNVLVHKGALPNATGNFSVTGIGFQADTAIVLSGQPAGVDASNNAVDCLAIGAIDASGGMMGLFRRITQNTTDYVWGAISTAEMSARLNTGATTFSSAVSHVSWDADGFTWNRTINNTTLSQYAVLLLKGQGTSKIVTTTARTSVTTWGVTVTGVTPTGILLLADNINTASSSSGVEAAQVSVGYADANSRWAQTLVTANRETVSAGQVTEEFTRGVTDKALLHWERTGADTLTAVGEIELSSFADESVTLNQTDADTTGVFITVLVFGQVFAGGGTATPYYYTRRRAA